MVYNGIPVRNHFDSSSHHHPGPSPGTSDHRKSFTTVIGAVLLDPTQTTPLMGKPCDSDGVSLREWAGLLVNRTCDESTQNTTQGLFRIRTHDIFVYQIVLLYQGHNNRMETSSGSGHVMMSAQVLFTRRVSVSECDPSQHWDDPSYSPMSQTSHVLVVV